jgi:osmotically-inducible protein OsmY
MLKTKSFWVAYFLVVGLALPAFSQQRSSQGGKYDQQIQQEITKALQKDKFQNVHAAVEDGVITLQGTVKLLIDKLDADKKAHHVDHVQGVNNLIQVEGNVSDSQLRSQLADKLRYDRVGYGIAFNALNLDVNNGVVTISGNVRDYPSRDSALAIVETTAGVKEVIDNITVAPTSNFDDELRVRLARAIYGHPALQKYAIDPQAPIRIVVDNGHVTLYGVVDSQMDKTIAETQAKSVSDVFSVDDKLVVANQQIK